MKHKRVLTDEQKQVLRDRLATARAAKQQKSSVAVVEEERPVVRERAPEVEAVIATMDPARRAKLQSIQARNLAQLAQTKDGREALERLEARHNPKTEEPITGQFDIGDQKIVFTPDHTIILEPKLPEPPKPVQVWSPMKAPFRLTGSQSGLMISELGPCHCGEQKLKWHPICLKVRANV